MDPRTDPTVPPAGAPAPVPCAAPGELPAAPGSTSAGEVYEHLVRWGPHARTDLARLLGLSGPTLTRLTRELLEAGLLRELPPLPQLKGRPQQPLDVDEDHARFIGIKITAQSVYAAVVTVRGVALEELSTELASADPANVVEETVALCAPLVAAHPRVAGVGVGIGAQVGADGTVAASAMLGWYEPFALRAVLEERLGLPVSVSNDFHALLEGLSWFGVGRRHRSFAVITIGAGVGVGSVVGTEVHRGRLHLAGLTGSLPTVTRDGRGAALRDVASTAHILEAARGRGAIAAGQGLDALVGAARARDEAALEVARDVAHAVAVAGAGLVGVLDPEALILGGEAVDLLRLGTDFPEALRSRLTRAQRDVVVRLMPAEFDDWARGAAVIAVRRFIGGEGA